MKQLLFLLIVTGFVCVVGCGQGASVKGKVSFPDGTPLTVGEVIFQTDNRMSSGKIQADGTYKLASASVNDGVPPGHYGVRIVGACDSSNTPPGAMPHEALPGIPLIDAKFEKTETSGLTCEVKGATTFDITVERAKK